MIHKKREKRVEIALRLKPLLKYTYGLEDVIAMAVTQNEYLANIAKVGAEITIGLV